MVVPLARRYLLSDKLRLAISTGGVAFAVLLIILILALYRGIYDQAGKFASDAPADLWVTQAGAPDPAHGASILPASVIGDLQKVPGVAAVQPLFGRTMEIGSQPNTGNFGFVIAIPEGPLQSDTAIAFGLSEVPGPGEMVLSNAAATTSGLSKGQDIYIGLSRYRVTDVADLTGSAFSGSVVINAADAAVALGTPDAYSFALVVVTPRLSMTEIEAAIEHEVPGTNALTRDAFADSTRREVKESFLPIVAVLAGVAFVVGLAVIALTMYTSTVERVRDYGVLKAVGAGSLQLFGLVLRQSLLVAVLGFVAGAVVGVLSATALESAVPEFTTLFRWQDACAVFFAALGMSALASVVPIRRVATIDPAVVFRA